MSPADLGTLRRWPIPGRVQELRRALNLTQQELATRAGVSLSCAYDAEHARCAASPDTQRRLAEALSVGRDELFGPSGAAPPADRRPGASLPSSDELPELLTVRECAALNGVSGRSVRARIRRGTLEALGQPDGSWLIPREAALSCTPRVLPESPGLLGTRDVAERYGLTQAAVVYNVHHGYLPAIRHLDGSLLLPLQIRDEAAEEWAKSRTQRQDEARVVVCCVVCGKRRSRPRSAVANIERAHCSRACYHADPDRRGARSRLLELSGRCGSPTCRDEDCTMPAGQCHRPACDQLATLAPRTSSPIRWVSGQPTLYCSQRCAVLDRNAGAPWGDRFAEYKASAGLRDVDEVAADLRRVRHGVMSWARRLGVGEQVYRDGKHGVWLFSPDDADAIARAIEDDPASRRYDEDPAFNARWYHRRHNSTKRYGQLAPQLSASPVGRPSGLSPAQAEQIRELVAKGRLSDRAIARAVPGQVSRSQVQRLRQADPVMASSAPAA